MMVMVIVVMMMQTKFGEQEGCLVKNFILDATTGLQSNVLLADWSKQTSNFTFPEIQQTSAQFFLLICCIIIAVCTCHCIRAR